MSDEHRAGMIEGLRMARDAIDRRLGELERGLRAGEARIRREELRAAKEGREVDVRESPWTQRPAPEPWPPRWPPDGEGQ